MIPPKAEGTTLKKVFILKCAFCGSTLKVQGTLILQFSLVSVISYGSSLYKLGNVLDWHLILVFKLFLQVDLKILTWDHREAQTHVFYCKCISSEKKKTLKKSAYNYFSVHW